MNKIISALKPHSRSSLVFVLFILFSSFTNAQDSARSASTFKFTTVVIDPGHGGKDPGAHGVHSLEKNIVLSIGKKLRTALQQQMSSLKVIMTRDDDTFIPLNTRSEIANKNKGNLFISIHCNSSPEKRGRRKGVEVFVYGFHRVQEQLTAIRENASIYQEKDYQKTYESYNTDNPVNRILLNAYMLKYRKQSILFGDLLNKEFKGDGRESIDVKEQGLLVLAHSAMPAVLVETGFINNPTEEDYLTSDEGQDEMVQSIIRAIKNYKEETAVR